MVAERKRGVSEGRRAALLVAAVVVAAYATAVPNGFAFDDHELVSRLPSRPGWSDVGHWITRPLFDQTPDETLGYWRPLSVVSFGLDRLWTGGDPRGFHLVNVLVHLVNAWLLLAWLRGVADGDRRRNARALAAVCLFAAHPATSDAVAAVAGRMDLLASTGVLAALWVACRRSGAGRARLVAVGGLTLAACLAKEIGAVTPVVLLAADVGRARGGEPGFRPSRRLPVYAVSAAAVGIWAGLRLAVVGTLGISAPIRWVDNPLVREGLGVRGWSALAVLGRYAALLFFPHRLSADYGYDSIPIARSPWDPWVAVGLLAVLAVISAVVLAFRHRATTVTLPAATLLVAPLLPVLPWPAASAALLAERYLYLSCAGFATIVAVGLFAAAARIPGGAHEGGGRRSRRTGGGRAAAWVSAALVLALATRTAARNPDWRDDLTLFQATTERFPRNVKALSNLAYRCSLTGDLERARILLERAVSVAPGFTENVLNLGNVYAAQGRLAEAVGAFRRRLADRPDDPRAHRNLGKVLTDLGRLDEAAEHLRRAIALDPDYANARMDLAAIGMRRGDWQGALEQYRDILEREPANGEAAFGASLAARAGGDGSTARAFALRARDAGYPLPDGYLESLP